jgi:hypothetical protein
MHQRADNFDRISRQPTFLNLRPISTIGNWLRMRRRRRLVRRLARLIARPVLHASVHADVEWQAAGIHEWDTDLPEDRQAQILATRLLEDTLLRIQRAFAELSELDSLSVCIREPLPRGARLIDGTVSREALKRCESCRSPAMSLKLLGLNYRLRDGRLTPIDAQHP